MTRVIITPENYERIDKFIVNTNELVVKDNLGTFNELYSNELLIKINKKPMTLWSMYVFNPQVREKYPNITFKFEHDMFTKEVYEPFHVYPPSPEKEIKNFLCSFNGTSCLSRKLLTAYLYKNKMFDSNYCSKNFKSTKHEIDNIIFSLSDKERFYRKFILDESDDAETFYQSLISLDYKNQNLDDIPENTTYVTNFNSIRSRINDSFLQIVSETLAESYHPLISEKFLYPVISRTFWISYAQPGWHDHLEKYYGFKKYSKIFDYKFDDIRNPVERLIELMAMISKFKHLSIPEWQDLYRMESDTLEYNYEWYKSRAYLKHLKKHAV